MAERVCIIHHLEEMWSDGYRKFGTSFDQEAEKIIDYLENETFDRVILVRFEDHELSNEHYLSGLSEYVDEVEAYGYGCEREWAEDCYPDGEDDIWAEGCEHSEVVMLDDWIKSLKGKEVTLTGAFENECILTLSTAMDHCEVDYTREEGLIVGSGVEYEFRGPRPNSPEEIVDKVERFARDQLPVAPLDKERQRNDVLAVFVGIDYEDARSHEVISHYHEILYGASSGYTAVLGDPDLLEVDESLYEESDTCDPGDCDIDDIEAINVTIRDNAFVVNEDDYPVLKLYRDVGVTDMPVHIEDIEDDPYETLGLSFETKVQYQKLQKAAERKLASLKPGESILEP